MPRESYTDVLILGAGLTGLSAARALEADRVSYRLVEQSHRVGGHAVTIEDDGYRFDRTGHLLHLRDETLQTQILESIGPDHVTIERRSRVYSHGVYTRYPFQANTHGLPAKVAFECVQGFVEAHFAQGQREPRDFEEFCLTRFGPGISRHFMLPYNSRLWGVPPSEITSEWCHRFVPVPQLEDVIAGAVGLHDRELGYNTHFVYPGKGIGVLPEALHDDLDKPAELNSAPRRIDFRRKRAHFRQETICYEALLSSIPLPVLVDLLDDPPEEVANAARKLRCTHLWYLDVALAAPAGHDYHWVYVPEERYPFYRVGCYTNFSSALAPAGRGSLYVELASRESPHLETLMREVVAGLTEMGWIRGASDIAFVKLRRIDHAYVIFDHQYFAALSVINPFLAEEGIVSAGRYGAWNYSSMEDALRFGREATIQVRELVDD